jgi:hypothetical protein
MSDKAKPADSKKFSKGGRAGRAPGAADRLINGTRPTEGSTRPMKGYALSKFRRHPPKGTKP